MGNGETKVADLQGQFLVAVEDGHRRSSPSWQTCRILLTSKRLGLLTGDDERRIPLADVDGIGERDPYTQQAAPVSEYLPLEVGSAVVLVSANDQASFETDLFRAALDGEVVPVKHPAVEGGVVRDVEWARGRLRIRDDALVVALEDGDRTTIARSDVGDLDTESATIGDEQRTVLIVEHADDGVSVETHLAPDESQRSVLQTMLEEGAQRNNADLDLSNTERRVVVALYSGVSPFDVPGFVGVDVERVEEIYDRLIELDVISVRRERTEVRLTPKGRKLAGEGS